MKKIFLLMFLVPVLCLGQKRMSSTDLSWTGSWVTTDTLKSNWLKLSQDSYFNVFIDWGTKGDSCNVEFQYWLHPAITTTGESITPGYIPGGALTAMVRATIDTTDTTTVQNGGRCYYSLHSPSTTAISPSMYVQFMLVPLTDHDSLKVDHAYFVKQD